MSLTQPTLQWFRGTPPYSHPINMATLLNWPPHYYGHLVFTVTSLLQPPRCYGHLIITTTLLLQPPPYYSPFILAQKKSSVCHFLHWRAPMASPWWYSQIFEACWTDHIKSVLLYFNINVLGWRKLRKTEFWILLIKCFMVHKHCPVNK